MNDIGASNGIWYYCRNIFTKLLLARCSLAMTSGQVYGVMFAALIMFLSKVATI